jgi:hypothetical protein
MTEYTVLSNTGLILRDTSVTYFDGLLFIPPDVNNPDYKAYTLWASTNTADVETAFSAVNRIPIALFQSRLQDATLWATFGSTLYSSDPHTLIEFMISSSSGGIAVNDSGITDILTAIGADPTVILATP